MAAMRFFISLVLLTLAPLAVACGDDAGSGGGGDGECSANQISVFQPDSDTPECHAIPSECNGTAACAEQACAAAMYAHCPGANVACSDLAGESTLITCN